MNVDPKIKQAGWFIFDIPVDNNKEGLQLNELYMLFNTWSIISLAAV